MLGVLVCLGAVACLPRERVNASCQWMADTTVLAPPGDPARRAHLIEDVRVAEDLGIRYGDSVVGRNVATERNLSLRAWCTDVSLAEIMRRHHVSRAELTAVTGARELWVDLLAVFLPMAVLFLVVSRAVVGRFMAGYEPGERGLAIALLVLWAPAAAALALGATQMWGWLVEMLRLGNEHISYRAFELPASRHGWLVWGVALALFAAVAARELRRRGEGSRPERRAAY